MQPTRPHFAALIALSYHSLAVSPYAPPAPSILEEEIMFTEPHVKLSRPEETTKTSEVWHTLLTYDLPLAAFLAFFVSLLIVLGKLGVL